MHSLQKVLVSTNLMVTAVSGFIELAGDYLLWREFTHCNHYTSSASQFHQVLKPNNTESCC